MPSYQIIKALDPSRAECVSVDHFFAKSSSHRPRTTVRASHSGDSIHVHFNVEDRFVRAVAAKYHDAVWRDSCVEFFVKPRPDKGYFNFEFSANGQFLISYITNPERVEGGFKEFVKVPWDLARIVRVTTSLPGRIEPEIGEPVTWSLTAEIPVSLMEHYTGPLGPLSGQTWRGNFYKCGDATSHPHWGAWSPITSGESFHQPAFFGTLILA
jgi:hypothetical protein